MLLSRLGASLLGNISASKGINRAGYRNKKRKEIIRASYGSKLDWFLIPLHPLTNFETQKDYQNKPRFNGVYSRDN